jgi:hypothetical protein
MVRVGFPSTSATKTFALILGKFPDILAPLEDIS